MIHRFLRDAGSARSHSAFSGNFQGQPSQQSHLICLSVSPWHSSFIPELCRSLNSLLTGLGIIILPMVTSYKFSSMEKNLEWYMWGFFGFLKPLMDNNWCMFVKTRRRGGISEPERLSLKLENKVKLGEEVMNREYWRNRRVAEHEDRLVSLM